ncbi:MAG: 50S ribosomal protein L4 [Candidatus Aminicenantes bacterium]|nr:50S ribosomal protein L4 [Candidatus Aminicenantes bacterium]
MLKLPIVTQEGKVNGEVNLPEAIFSYPIKKHILYETVVNFLANQRQGTASTKTRGEVSGSNRKPWRQKGTGRARAGSIRSPLWRKGGTVFGPKPRDYRYEIPKQVKKNALKSALALRYREKKLLLVDELHLKQPKTKDALQLLKQLKVDSALVVDLASNRNLFLAMRNLPQAKAVDVRTLNVYDILKFNWLIFSQRAFDTLMSRFES